MLSTIKSTSRCVRLSGQRLIMQQQQRLVLGQVAESLTYITLRLTGPNVLDSVLGVKHGHLIDEVQ